jgi:hypothetical protein
MGFGTVRPLTGPCGGWLLPKEVSTSVATRHILHSGDGRGRCSHIFPYACALPFRVHAKQGEVG